MYVWPAVSTSRSAIDECQHYLDIQKKALATMTRTRIA